MGREIKTDTVVLEVSDGSSMPCYVARPSDSGASSGGLIVLQEAFGVNAHIRDITERFAREGYTAIAPALFHRTDADFEGSYTDFGAVRPHISAMTTDGQAADITAAFHWLSEPAHCGADAIAAIGYCMGGTAAYLANATVPIKAAVTYYGGGIAPNQMRPEGLLDRAKDQHGPILLFWGGKDGHLGPDQRNDVEQALVEAGKSYIQVVFGDADHGFFCDARASYNPAAAALAWPLTLSFLASHLG